LNTLPFFDAATIRRRLDWPRMIAALESALMADIHAPVRVNHSIEVPGSPPGSLLLMPAWQVGDRIGVKLVTVMPGKESKSVSAVYVLFDGVSGVPLAMMDGEELTARRTAGASALAAKHLAREDASHLVMIGSGRQSAGLVAAHASVRPIRRVTIWSRTSGQADHAAKMHRAAGLDASSTDDLEASVREADIVSCATLSTAPLVKGEWLRPGTHLDLVGAFKADMRESDDEAMRRADRIIVDDRAAALAEGGDVVQALRSGAIALDRISGDLRGLVSGDGGGRQNAAEITVFKSVGFALEDLAAAKAVMAAAEQAGYAPDARR
jgi:ornithine cyclodeaminase/alanine dehydrogenase-like protein (mu-crystallin family)